MIGGGDVDPVCAGKRHDVHGPIMKVRGDAPANGL
jgi:hypothetical protein